MHYTLMHLTPPIIAYKPEPPSTRLNNYYLLEIIIPYAKPLIPWMANNTVAKLMTQPLQMMETCRLIYLLMCKYIVRLQCEVHLF